MATKNYAEVQVIINGELAENELEKLKAKAQQLKQQAVDIFNQEGNSKKFKSLSKEINTTEKNIKKLSDETFSYQKVLNNLNGAKLSDLRKTVRELSREISGLTPGTEEFIRKSEQLKQVNSRVKSLESAYKAVGYSSNRIEQIFRISKEVWSAFDIASRVLTGISTTFRGCAEAVAKLDDTYSDVMKTTGMTREEVAALNEELMKMDTRTSREALNNLARDAGKLGITGTEDVLAFVRAADKINVALGEDLGDDAIKNLGKIADVMGLTKSMGIEDSLLSIGSAINSLGQASTASEAYLVDFTQRLAGVGAQTGLSVQNILGFASGLDQSAMKVEMAATAFQKFIMNMFADTATYAKYAGMEVSDFAELLRTDTNSAIITVLSSLREKGGFEQLVPIFKDMGMDGARATSVLASMATNMQAVTDAQSLANAEFAKASSIQAEYDTKNNNLQASLEKARKEFDNARIALGEKLNPIMLQSTKLSTNLIKALVNYGKEITTVLVVIGALTLALKAKTIWQKAVVTWNATMRTGSLALAAAQALLTGNVTRATAAWTMMNTAMKASVIGLVVTAISALVIGLGKLLKNTSDAAAATKELTRAQKDLAEVETSINERYTDEAARIRFLTEIINSNSFSLNKRREAIDELKQIIPGYHAQLTEEGVLMNNNAEAIQNYLKQLEDRIRLEELVRKRAGLNQQLDELNSKKLEQQQKYPSVTFTEDGRPVRQFYDSSIELVDYDEQINPLMDSLREIDTMIAKITERHAESGQNPLVSFSEALEALKKQQAEYDLQLKESYADKKLTQEEYQNETLKSNLNFAKQQLDLAVSYGEDETEYMNAYLDAMIAVNEHAQKAITKIEADEEKRRRKEEDAAEKEKLRQAKEKLAEMQRLAEDLHKQYASPEDYYKSEFAKLEELYREKLITEEVYQKALADLRAKYSEESLQLIADNESLSRKERFQAEKAELAELLKEQFITQEEYEKSLRDMKLKYAKETVDIISSLVSQTGSLISSLRDMELAQAEVQYREDLKNASNNAMEKERIEEDYEAKQLEIKKKYANADMSVQILEATASNALALMQAWTAAGGNPYIFAAYAALIASTYAATVATIIAQRNALMNTTPHSSGSSSASGTPTGNRTLLSDGMKSGGYAGTSDSDDTPMGIYHANEYIAPAWMVRKNPVLFANLEQYRRTGVETKLIQASGMQNGGYASVPHTETQPAITSSDIDRFVKAIDKLSEEGIQAFMVYSQYDKFNQQRSRFKSITSKK